MPYFVYILHSVKFDRYYIGQTQDMQVRISRHNKGLESFTKPFAPWEIKCVIEKESRSEAMALEKKLKNLNRDRLLKFIEKYSK